MTRIVISAEVDRRETRAADPNDEWDSGDTEGHVTNVIAYVETEVHYYYGASACVDLVAGYGTTVYAVVADYDSGSTFGHDGGHAQVLDGFLTPEEAKALLDAANAGTEHGFEHNGKDYSRSWVGYFESLNSLDIWDVQVRLNPADPFRPKGTGRYSLKRGS
jgi:hypothetical protein